MKKISMLIAAVTLAAPAPMIIAAPAAAASNSSTVRECKDIVAYYNGALSVGACVSFITSELNYYKNGSPGYAPHYCAVLDDLYPGYVDGEYGSYSACVQTMMSEI